MDAGAIMDRIVTRAAELADVASEEITDETSFESLGLDSSDAVILAMEAEEFIGQEIDVGIFLRFATLREAATEISKLSDGAPSTVNSRP
jgi:acyl carrier protein